MERLRADGLQGRVRGAGGETRPRPPLALVDGPLPPRPSSAPPAGTSPPSGTAAARAARSGARSWRRLLAGRPPAGRGGGRRSGRALTPVALRDVRAPEVARLQTGIGELDRVLGGGLVPGSLVLLGGSPGIGKSTITASALGNLAAAGHDVLYVSGEESAAQVRLRAERLGAGRTGGADRGETRTSTPWSRRIEAERPAVCVVDSVQVMHVDRAQRRPGVGGPGARGGGPADGRGQGARQRRGPRRPRDQGGIAGRTRGCSSTWWTACCPSRASASAPTARCAR